MRSIAFIGMALAAMSSVVARAQTRPVIIEESAILTPPPGITYKDFGWDVGTNGEYALVTAERPTTGDDNTVFPFDALLYRKSNGSWTFQRILAQGSRNLYEDDSYYPVKIAMKGSLASTQLGESTPATIHRFNGTDWVASGAGAGLQEDVSIDGERILYGVGETWNGRVYEPDGAGGWTDTFLPGQNRCCDDEFWGGPVDLLGDRAILATPYVFDLEPQEIPIYQKNAGVWSLLTKLQVPCDTHRLGAEVALHENNAIVNGLYSGAYVWTNGSFYGDPQMRLQAVNAYARNASILRFAKDGSLLLTSGFDPDFGAIIINVFRLGESGRYERVAILKPKTGSGALTGDLEIDGNTVIAGSRPRAFIFELPATLTGTAPRYENFESGNGANWTPGPGAQFTVVRPSAANAVYRQSSVTGDAHSVLGNSALTNQGVEADIKPTAFNCADCWVGLATRFVDIQNHYYVTLRYSGSVQLKRMRNGVFTTLASAPMPVQLNHTYRVRLDSIGNTHRVYVDGRLLLSFDDSGPVVAGNAAVIMYKARADYDNVVVSPGPRSTIFTDNFNTPATWQGDWTHTGPGQWTHANGVLVQNSVAAEARALIGTPTDDQSVAFRVRPTAFAATSTGQERWVGLIARYRDDRNYYYLTLRSGGFLSLRKLVNGVITPIRDVPANVTVGTRYALRLDVTGSSLRAYLNGNLLIQETDTTHATGRTGAMTWKAAAEFDDYLAYQQ
jgi:hypothetical protein